MGRIRSAFYFIHTATTYTIFLLVDRLACVVEAVVSGVVEADDGITVFVEVAGEVTGFEDVAVVDVAVPIFPKSSGGVVVPVLGVVVPFEPVAPVVVASVDVAFVLVEVNGGMFNVDVASVEVAVGSFKLKLCVLVASVELAVVVVVVRVVVPTASVLEAVTVTVTGLVVVETVVTGTGGKTIGGTTTGCVEVAVLEVEVAVVDVAVEVSIGTTVEAVVVASVDVASVAVVSGTTVTGVGPPIRCVESQYATAETPSDHEAKVVMVVPVFPTFPGLNVDAPVPAVPRRESNSMIATVNRVSTAYLVVASITI